MQQQNFQANAYFSESGLLDPEQFEHEYMTNIRMDRKGDASSPGDLISPWEDNKYMRSRRQDCHLPETFNTLDRPTMAQTDRTGKFRNIFDLAELSRTKKHFRDVASKVDNKWDGYSNTIDAAVKAQRKTNLNREVVLPKPLPARMLQLQPSQILPMSLDRKKFRSPNKLSTKRHLVQDINYRQIEQSMFHKPTAASRFDLFCKKLETKPILSPEAVPVSDRIRVINFPIAQDETQDKHPSKKVIKDRVKEYKNTKHSLLSSYYMRSRLNQQRRLNQIGQIDPVPERAVDFRELLNENHELRLANAKKHRSRIFSMILRI